MKKLPVCVLSLCAFIMAACGGARGTGNESRDSDLCVDGNVAHDDTAAMIALDYDIAATRRNIDSLRGCVGKYGLDSLRKNSEYKYIIENQPAIDSMKILNDSLLSRAYDIARRHSQFTIVRRDATLFNDFSLNPAVRQIGWKYLPNYVAIEKFNRQKNDMRGLRRDVCAYCDSVVLARMYDAQNKLDSLLTRKYELVNSKQK